MKNRKSIMVQPKQLLKKHENDEILFNNREGMKDTELPKNIWPLKDQNKTLHIK